MCTAEGVHAQNDSEVHREKKETFLVKEKKVKLSGPSLKQLTTLCENRCP